MKEDRRRKRGEKRGAGIMLATGVSVVMLIVSLKATSTAEPRNSEMATILHRPIRAISYPSSSSMGIFFALSVPLEDPLNSVSLSYFFEASYALPANSSIIGDLASSRDASAASSYSTTTSTSTTATAAATADARNARRRRRRGIDRSTVYAVLQNKFERAGFPGHDCLLRSICEASEYPLEHNGLVGDIFHLIFTPSSSRPEDGLPSDVIEAELRGRKGTCSSSRYYSLCPLGLFDLIGILQ